jgi:hypothetical protein
VGDSLVFGVFYLVKHYDGFIYFIPHTIKMWLKNVATLIGFSFEPLDERIKFFCGCNQGCIHNSEPGVAGVTSTLLELQAVLGGNCE